MSGAGKSQAIRCLEDLGFFCVDNLPPSLIPTFADLCAQSERRIDRVGLVMDVREGAFLDQVFDTLVALRRAGHPVEVVFLDTSDEGLVRRFSESRRPHPLAPHGSVLEGIRAERQLLARLKATADLVVDTTPLTIHELRKVLTSAFQLEAGPPARMAISLLSFGYKHGLPFDADLVLDVRFLPNPQFQPELKESLGGRGWQAQCDFRNEDDATILVGVVGCEGLALRDLGLLHGLLIVEELKHLRHALDQESRYGVLRAPGTGASVQ